MKSQSFREAVIAGDDGSGLRSGIRADVVRLCAALRAREVVEVDDLALLAGLRRRPSGVGGLVDLERVLDVRMRRPRVSDEADLPRLVRLVCTSEWDNVDADVEDGARPIGGDCDANLRDGRDLELVLLRKLLEGARRSLGPRAIAFQVVREPDLPRGFCLPPDPFEEERVRVCGQRLTHFPGGRVFYLKNTLPPGKWESL